MCGRYTLVRLADLADVFPWIRLPEHDPPPRYNIAPTQPVAVVANDGRNVVDFMRWGLIPFWAKDPSIGNRMINARAESLVEKPVFRSALQRRRCIIPASGFYEWRKNRDGTKTPMYIRHKSRRPLLFAGLWERWHAPDGSEVPTCTIITGPANELVRPIHDRMPVILPPEEAARWLEPGEKHPLELMPLLRAYRAQELEAYPVSARVNKPREESPDCIESITDEPKEGEGGLFG
jgi:putative SOS response-associated peptidase YedK